MLALLSSVTGLLLLAALVFVLLHANNRAPLWIGVLLLTLANLLSFGFGR